MLVALRQLSPAIARNSSRASRTLATPFRLLATSSRLQREPLKGTSTRRPNRNGKFTKPFVVLPTKTPGPSDLNEVRLHLRDGLGKWCRDTSVSKQLQDFGLDKTSVQTLLSQFKPIALEELKVDDQHSDSIHRQWHLPGLASGFVEDLERTSYKAYFLRLMDFSISPQSPLSEQESKRLRNLRQATDLEHPGQRYPAARSLRRKIYLHVGPTNSGKTYSALRALAAAKTGVYCGPLRLLAHEVWERLNNGSIMAPPKNTGF